MRQYPSKLLLFGEHILLIGARALAVPVQAFGGQWAWQLAHETPEPWTERLRAFAQSPELATIAGLDTQSFREDLTRGLFFKSSIPVGYGLGSSGALCAAVYDRYARERTTDLAELKQVFAAMERFFHGQSSGIDPLTSYLNRPIWINNRAEVSFFAPQPWRTEQPVVFLLDSHLPRKTGPLVQWFLDQSQQADFARLLERELLPAHEALLDAWQAGDAAAFWPALRRVSAFQLEHLPPMIPDSLRSIWETSLAGDEVVLKICGAGGGGFVLGFARSKAVIAEKFSTFTPILPFEQYAVVEK